MVLRIRHIPCEDMKDAQGGSNDLLAGGDGRRWEGDIRAHNLARRVQEVVVADPHVHGVAQVAGGIALQHAGIGGGGQEDEGGALRDLGLGRLQVQGKEGERGEAGDAREEEWEK